MIELLLTLTISAFLISITAGVLISTVETNNRAQHHIQLRQEANVIMTQLRNHHQEGKYFTCFEDYLGNDELTFETITLTQDSEIQCDLNTHIDPEKDLHVSFTLADFEQEYELNTTIESRDRMGETKVDMPPPEQPPEEDFFTYLKSNNVFVYGSHLGISGSSVVNENTVGTIVIHNLNETDLSFNGNNRINVENIFINKEGQRVIFSSSTKMGNRNTTDTVSIRGDVELNNGGAEISAETVAIDGNVEFGSSAQITANQVIISGDVVFKNWAATIVADDIQIGGNITYRQPGNVEGSLAPFREELLPEHPETSQPPLREDSWYEENEYSTIEPHETVRLEDGDKIFGNSITVETWHPDRENVVIVSKEDIHIENFGGSKLTGVLLAPNGEVTFDGNGFEGVVIARDGFHTFGNPSLTFKNIDNYFSGVHEFPFEVNGNE